MFYWIKYDVVGMLVMLMFFGDWMVMFEYDDVGWIIVEIDLFGCMIWICYDGNSLCFVEVVGLDGGVWCVEYD